jgi:hypothetical protein
MTRIIMGFAWSRCFKEIGSVSGDCRFLLYYPIDGKQMIDIHQLLHGLTRDFPSADFPDATSLAAALDLDLSKATITKTKKKTMCISGARLNGSGIEVGLVCGVTPLHAIWLLLLNAGIPYRDVKDETFGANQRIKQSKVSSGFAVLFDKDGLCCGFTVDPPSGDVNRLFCEEPNPALAVGLSGAPS